MLQRLRQGDDAEVAELRELSPTDLQLSFDDMPAADLSIEMAATASVELLPDEVFETLDVSRLSDVQRHRLLNRVLTGIGTA